MPKMQHHFSLKNYNSFGIDVSATLYATPETIEELKGVLDQYDFTNLPYLVMGEGSNLLFKGDFEGLVLNPRMKGIELVEDGYVNILLRNDMVIPAMDN